MAFKVLSSDKHTHAQYLPLKGKQTDTENKKEHQLRNILPLVKGFSSLLSYI